MNMEDVSGIILAGGQSRRMGRNKAELLLMGKTFLEWQIEKLQNLGITDIILSGPEEPPQGTRRIPDQYQGRGPLGGLHASLSAARFSPCLVVTVDAPLVPAELLLALLEEHERGHSDVTVLSIDGELQPLLAVYEKNLVGPIAELIRQRSRPVRALFDVASVREFPYFGNTACLMNCNTPADYQRLCMIASEIHKNP